MRRSWRWVALAACPLFGCMLLKKQPSVSDAGTTGEGEGPGETADAAASAGELPPAAPSTISSAEPTHKHVGARCGGKEVAILLQPGEEACVTECKSTAGCPAGWACDGEGVLSSSGRPGNAIGFCRIASRGKGTDGGPPAAAGVDAGPAPHEVQPDAGAPKKLDVKLVNGQCPSGYRPCGARCRLACAKDGDCGLGVAHCQDGFCLGPGVLPCAK
jgi:hypothetical protein